MDVSVEEKIIPDYKAKEIFEKEFMHHLDAMYNFALKLTADEDDAQDLVQDTCVKAFRFIGSFEPGTYAKAWLFRILKNNFINDYRKLNGWSNPFLPTRSIRNPPISLIYMQKPCRK